jgi:hypothetical protein
LAAAVVEAWAAAATSPVASAAATKALRPTKTANKLSTTTMWIDQQKLARSLAQGGQSQFIAKYTYITKTNLLTDDAGVLFV